jgi:hypothetical protein
VILNSHADGCDGIIIPNPTSEPLHVAFPDASPDLLQSKKVILKQLLLYCGVKTRGDSESTRLNDHSTGFSERRVAEDFDDLLTWLWKNIVDLVYQILVMVSADEGYSLETHVCIYSMELIVEESGGFPLVCLRGCLCMQALQRMIHLSIHTQLH